MIRGTRLLVGNDARKYIELIDSLRRTVVSVGFSEVILPSIWESGTFLKKIGQEKSAQIWSFKDRGDRDVCLIPEATGIIQEMWDSDWSKSWPKPSRIFYVQRCYRYERPQRGRYREFTQFGVEILGGGAAEREECVELLKKCLDETGVSYALNDSVKRGIGYYVGNGFEAECQSLGAQKQVAGGGTYDQGVGWAIGVDRLLLALEE